eukprot:3681756-Pyramimonas_sp.AAC.1
MLCHADLFYAMLCYGMLHHRVPTSWATYGLLGLAMLCYAKLYATPWVPYLVGNLCFAILCYSMLCYTIGSPLSGEPMLCHAALCCAMLCYAMHHGFST